MDLVTLEQTRWKACKINPNRVSLFQAVANRLTAPAAVARYKAVEKLTGVPWWFIAVVHEREAGQNWNLSLAQGDPWNRRSVHVPAGRGPFASWEDAAVDALHESGAAANKDWSPGKALSMLEKYNGLGYYQRGIPSPYIWAGTNQYVSGKYIADGVFSPSAVDQQLGCAGLLIQMKAFNSVAPVATGTGAGAVIVTGGAIAASQMHHSHLPVIIGAVVLSLIVIGIGVLIYKFNNQGKQ